MPAPLLGRFGCRFSASESVGTAAKPLGGTSIACTIGAGINDGE
jgi:hypothetical protein